MNSVEQATHSLKRIPEIPITIDPENALDEAIKFGAAIFKLGVKRSEIQSQFEELEKENDTSQSLMIDRTLVTMTSLRVIVDYLRNKIDNPPNIVNVYNLELGRGSSLAHYDYGGGLLGVSLLVPIYHGAEFAVHDKISEQIVLQSHYGPGDVMILRQNYEKLEPTLHSAVDVTNRYDHSNTRTLLSFDNSS